MNASFVKEFRDEKLEFHVYTINHVALAQHFKKLNIDSITTDVPATLKAAFK
jgi:glycerophosphoryl diester phosphodiesterase